jgi:hypothetical protein
VIVAIDHVEALLMKIAHQRLLIRSNRIALFHSAVEGRGSLDVANRQAFRQWRHRLLRPVHAGNSGHRGKEERDFATHRANVTEASNVRNGSHPARQFPAVQGGKRTLLHASVGGSVLLCDRRPPSYRRDIVTL